MAEVGGEVGAALLKADLWRRSSSIRVAPPRRFGRAGEDSVSQTAALALQREQQVVSTVMGLEHRRFLELPPDADPRDVRLVLARQIDLVSLKITSPLSGRVLPVMMSIIVVLPAPFGPMIARSSPGVDGEAKGR